MIKEFEKQMMLTKKTNELLNELKEYTAEIKLENEVNLHTLKTQVETDVQEIVDYCIQMGIPKNKTGWEKPSESVSLRDGKDNSIVFHIMYDTKKDKYEWYVGRYSYGIGYTICDGLFCGEYSFSNYNPAWSYGFLSHNNTESNTVQYICSNWKELREKIIAGISEKIAKDNERKIQEANKALEKGVGDLISSNEELARCSERYDNMSESITPTVKRKGR